MDKRLSNLSGGSRSSFSSGRALGECRTPSASLNRLEQDEDDMEYARSVERSAQHSAMGRNSVPKLSPYFAAAMLSLPWPPAAPKKNVKDSDIDDSSDFDFSPSKMATGVASTLSRKLYRKKKSKSKSTYSYLVNDHEESTETYEPEYRPFSIPQFQEVHTNWPGFEHEPISNWEEKYMIAKPYPKKAPLTVAEPSKSGVLSKPSVINNNNSNSNATVDSDAEGEAESGKRVPKNKSKTTSGKPRRRVYVERVGSCVR